VLVGAGGVQHNYFSGRTRISLPHRIGVVPEPAHHRQHRPVEDALQATVTGTVGACVIVTGPAGVGKTQVAATVARRAWDERLVDLLIWTTAGERSGIVTAYARAAADVTGAEDSDPTDGAARLLAWLASTDRRWLVVLDDLVDPTDLTGLWPPTTRHGCTVVTTRRRDVALLAGRQRLDVTPWSPAESHRYLAGRLAEHPALLDEPGALAADLDHLPLALAQASAYLIDRNLTCSSYRRRLATHRMTDLVTHSLPDQHRTAAATSWALSVELAGRLEPRGLARPLLELAALLDPNGLPLTVITSTPVVQHCAERVGRHIDADDTLDAVRILHNLSLATVDDAAGTVRVPVLVQRSIRDLLEPDQIRVIVNVVADALVAVWPEDENGPEAEASLRSNAAMLKANSRGTLLAGHPHALLYRLGRSLTRSGDTQAARALFEELFDHLRTALGLDHRWTLGIRYELIRTWSDSAEATTALTHLLTACHRNLGPDDTLTLFVRSDLSGRRGVAGDAVAAAREYEEMLPDFRRVFGPDHRHVMVISECLADWRGETGDAAGAAAVYEEVLAAQQRILGPDHVDTLNTRLKLVSQRMHAHQLAHCVEGSEQASASCSRRFGWNHPLTLQILGNLAAVRQISGDAAGAIATYELLLWSQAESSSADRSDSSKAREHLANAQKLVGDDTDAVATFERMVDDHRRVFGPDHPYTLYMRFRLAGAQGDADDTAGAMATAQALLPDWTCVHGPAHQDTLALRALLARLLEDADEQGAAEQAYAELLADVLRSTGPDSWLALVIRWRLIDIRTAAGDESVIAAYPELLDDMLRVLGPDDATAREARQDYATAQKDTGDILGAITTYEEIVADHERLLGADHPDTLKAKSTLAALRTNSGDVAGATSAYQGLLADYLRTVGPDNRPVLRTRAHLAHLMGKGGDPAAAVAALQELIPDCDRVLGPMDDNTLKIRDLLGHWLGTAGDIHGAIAAYEKLHDDMDRILGSDHPGTLAAWRDLQRWRRREDGSGQDCPG
jgi:tetratricopeptide (TPR) repeat protein